MFALPKLFFSLFFGVFFSLFFFCIILITLFNEEKNNTETIKVCPISHFFVLSLEMV